MEACGYVQRRQRHGDGRVSGNCELPHLAGCGDSAYRPAACVDPLGDVEVVESEAEGCVVIGKW